MAYPVQFETGTHRQQDVIFIRFEKNTILQERVKKLAGSRWSKSQKAWYVPDNVAYRKKFGITVANTAINSTQPGISPLKQAVRSKARNAVAIYPVNQLALNAFTQTLLLKAYSPSTIRTYKNEFSTFLHTIQQEQAKSLTTQRIKDYLQYCYTTLKLSENTIHSRMNALKFYYEQVLGREKFFWEIPRPKKHAILPNVLAISQVEKLFSHLENLKHKTMLYLAYSAGLRVSEVVNLEIKDIHSERMVININGAKGKKDRTVGLSEGILLLLRKYYKVYTPIKWLFEGQDETKPYSTRSLQQVFHRAKKASKIVQAVTFHSLRHSYATHLHESGTDIKLIQELLGHNDLKTTLRYTHVSKLTIEKVKSPFDALNLKNQ